MRRIEWTKHTEKKIAPPSGVSPLYYGIPPEIGKNQQRASAMEYPFFKIICQIEFSFQRDCLSIFISLFTAWTQNKEIELARNY